MALNRRNRVKSGFLDKALGHLGRFDPSGLQSVVQRLAKEREFLESLFNTIDSGIIVTDDQGRMVYFNLMATRMLGIPPETAEEEPVTRYLPDLDWAHISALDRAGGHGMFRTEFEVEYPRHRLIRLNVRPSTVRRRGVLDSSSCSMMPPKLGKPLLRRSRPNGSMR